MGRRVCAGRRSHRACGGGFALIELVICIGTIMILVGLVAPALGNAISRARLMRDKALVRHQAMVISMYAADFQETHPYLYGLTGHLYRVAGDWVRPMVASGHVDAFADMDPDYARGPGILLHDLTRDGVRRRQDASGAGASDGLSAIEADADASSALPQRERAHVSPARWCDRGG